MPVRSEVHGLLKTCAKSEFRLNAPMEAQCIKRSAHRARCPRIKLPFKATRQATERMAILVVYLTQDVVRQLVVVNECRNCHKLSLADVKHRSYEQSTISVTGIAVSVENQFESLRVASIALLERFSSLMETRTRDESESR
jgi:hypothetical protein